MISGVPKEIKDRENRVLLTLGGARLLIQLGHPMWSSSVVAWPAQRRQRSRSEWARM